MSLTSKPMERLSSPEHWNMIYGKYERHQLGWYSPLLKTSLEWISKYAASREAAIADIGGGSSTLVDELLDRSFSKITLVDLSETALAETRKRLGKKVGNVNIVCADIRSKDLQLPTVHLWHDRAAFHFLRDAAEIEVYKQKLVSALSKDGVFLLGVFSENAPERCSGLLVNRRTLEGLKQEFESDFELVESRTEIHVTPGGVNQEYIYTAWKRSSPL